MKKISSLMLLALLLWAPSGWTQGLINFNNHLPGAEPAIDAPIFDVDGTNKLAGEGYLAQVFAGPSETELTPVGAPVPFQADDKVGYVDVARSHAGPIRVIRGVAPGQPAVVQVRAWEQAAGGSYEQAVAAAGKHGASALFTVIAGGDGHPPANLIGLESFQLIQPAPVAPTITKPPQSQTVVVGTNMIFKVSAAGTRPLRYQWRFNGADMPCRTNAVLVLERAQSTDSGNYSVVVANEAGSVASAPATLHVQVAPPCIVSQPINQTVPEGANVAFRVFARGTWPFKYQWTLNGVPLPKATNAVYWVEHAQGSNTGNYAVTAANSAGSVTSTTASLRIIPGGNSPQTAR